MYAGLDVGGTHTDAVLASALDGACLAAVKVPTRQHDLLGTAIAALEALFAAAGQEGLPQAPARVRRLTVSTTLGLNALLSKNTDPVGMLALPGPGIDPRLFWDAGDALFHILPGALDHRGRLAAPTPDEPLAQAAQAIVRSGAKALAVVCKFGPKHPGYEQELAERALALAGEAAAGMPVVLGAQAGGGLNFPRRLHTAWCNAALHARMRDFLDALAQSAGRLGLACPLAILKADAGSFPAAQAALDPASTMGSGPAASLLGVWSFLEGPSLRAGSSAQEQPQAPDALMIDMGGTTTDLALLAKGQPLLAPEGLRVDGRPTLIRALWTRSLALGGDSCLRCAQDGLRIGPDRAGYALALEKDGAGDIPGFLRPPTLTDALNVLGLAAVGDPALSARALARLASSADCPSGCAGDARRLARAFIDTALAIIASGAKALLSDVNSRPVYTIRELLVSDPVRPLAAVFIGGPAPALAGEAEQALGLPVLLPQHSPYANALGAALAKPTLAAELHADTRLKRMSIPALGISRSIAANYGLEEAQRDLANALAAERNGTAAPEAVQLVYAERFALLEDDGGRGHILHLKAQLPAGLMVPDRRPGETAALEKNGGRV